MLLRSLALSLVPFFVACAVTAPSSEGTNGGPVSPASSPRPRGLPPVQAPLHIQGSAEGASMVEVMDRLVKSKKSNYARIRRNFCFPPKKAEN